MQMAQSRTRQRCTSTASSRITPSQTTAVRSLIIGRLSRRISQGRRIRASTSSRACACEVCTWSRNKALSHRARLCALVMRGIVMPGRSALLSARGWPFRTLCSGAHVRARARIDLYSLYGCVHSCASTRVRVSFARVWRRYRWVVSGGCGVRMSTRIHAYA